MVKIVEQPPTAQGPQPVNGTKQKVSAAADVLSGAPETAESALREVRTLVEAGKVRLARERTASYLEIWPDDTRLQAADRVLGPPKDSPQNTTRPRTSGEQEFKWIREHALEYSGQWVALLEDRLLASGKDLKTVLAELKAIEGGSDALLHFQPSGPWIVVK